MSRRGWRITFAIGAIVILMPLLGASSPRAGARVISGGPSQEMPSGNPLNSLSDFSAVNAPETDPPLVRKDFNTLGDAAVASMRNGIAAMMKLDESKADKDLSPLGWKYQASIHGVPPGTARQEAWNTCQHSSWFFLSWHRMELYFFERILRAMAKDPSLTLAYWNFSVPPAGMDPANFGARLPAAFRVKPTDTTPNALWWQFRDPNVNMPPGPGAMDNAAPLDHSVVATLKAFSQSAFFSNVEDKGRMSFGGGAISFTMHSPGDVGEGQIERIPHNQVHGAVGDGTRQSMSDPGGAGLDPIFWPVHANIDRAWSCWQEKHPGSEPKSAIWLKNMQFTFFDVKTNDDGTLAAVKVTMTGQQVIDTANQLGYVYDNNCQNFELPAQKPGGSAQSSSGAKPSGSLSTHGPAWSAMAESPSRLAEEPVTVWINIPSEMRMRIEDLIREGAPTGSIVLTIGGVAVDQPTGASYGIYLNLPKRVLPNHQVVYYADELSFFGVGHHRPDDAHGGNTQENRITYDVTDVFRKLIANGEWLGDQVSVTFANTSATLRDRVAPPAAPANAHARFRYISLTVE